MILIQAIASIEQGCYSSADRHGRSEFRRSQGSEETKSTGRHAPDACGIIPLVNVPYSSAYIPYAARRTQNLARYA